MHKPNRKIDAVRQVTVIKKRSDPICSTLPNRELNRGFRFFIMILGWFSSVKLAISGDYLSIPHNGYDN
jgi:hypothetical protein